MIHYVESIGSYIVMVAANCRTVSTVFIVASLEQSHRTVISIFWGRNWKDCSNGLMSIATQLGPNKNHKVPNSFFFRYYIQCFVCDLVP